MNGGTKSVPADTFNAYGQRNTPNVAAAANSQSIAGALPGVTGAAQTQATMGGNNLNAYGNNVLSGQYLAGSPQLTNQYANIVNQASRQSNDQNAQLQSQYARAGMNFSTANQNAQQANTASNLANAQSTAANLLGNNYSTERGYQQQAGTVLGQANNLYFNPLAQEAQINLTANGQNQLAQPNIIQQAGPLQYLSQGIQGLAGAAKVGAGIAAMA